MLPKPEEKQLCVAAAAALTRFRERALAEDKSQQTLDATVELWRAASRAERKLRFRNMEYMGTEGLSLPSPSASASASASPRPRPSPSATPGHDHSEHEGSERRDDPFKPILTAYDKLAVEALRYLAVFLELGPKQSREAALGEIERLWREESRPPEPLPQIVRQAYLLESDPGLQGRLKKLEQHTHLTPRDAGAR